MKKFLFGIILLFGLNVQSYAMSDALLNKVADILVAKIEADKEVAIAAIQNSPKITIDGKVYNHVIIGEDAILIGNGGVLLLGDIDIGDIHNEVELRQNSLVIGNIGVTAGGG